MKHSTRKLNSAGDTIIEVMIVLAVLGLAFAIASATATKGLNQSRNAQEHSQALGILSTQVELLRTAIADKKAVSAQTGVFCVSSDANLNALTDYSSFASSTTDSSNGYAAYPSSCTQGNYHTGVDYNSDSNGGYYDIRVRWDGVGTLGPQQERFVYRIHEPSGEQSDIATETTTGRIQVNVQRLRPGVACTSTASTDVDTSIPGANITLRQQSGGNLVFSRTVNGSTLFEPLADYTSWNVTFDSAPAGYERCPVNGSSFTSSNYAINPTTNSHTVTLKMRSSSWSNSINGRDYTQCDRGEPGYPDSFNGCFITGSSVFARRQVNIQYNLGTTFVATRTVRLVINYNQYAGANTVPPPSYGNFRLLVKFGPPGSLTGNQNITLPIDSSTSSWTARTSTNDVSIPAGSSVMEIGWINNAGSDPDLQINSIQLSHD